VPREAATPATLVVRPEAAEPAVMLEAHRVAEALRERGLIVTLGDDAASTTTEVVVQSGGGLHLREASRNATYDTIADLTRALSEHRP
jgi:hypothetical protein